VVDTLVDESDGDFSRGELSLREAIELANAQPGADEIVFDPALIASGPGTILLTKGELEIGEALTVAGPGASQLIVDASGNDPTATQNNQDGSRVFSVPGASAALELRGMTITGGDVAGAGGGVRSLGELTLRECVLTQNSASSFGGGALAIKLTAYDSTIDHNTVVVGPSSGAGGGIYASEMMLERSALLNNTSGGSGGGMHAAERLTVRDSVISGNTAFEGGGGASAAGDIEMTGVVVAHNRAERGFRGLFDGGGLFLVASGNITITGSTFANNFSSASGGAIAAGLRDSQLTLLHTTVSGNMASRDSGIRGAVVTVRHSTVVNNGIVGVSGGLSTGGGIAGARITLEHSIVAGNSAPQSGHYDVQGAVTARWSLIGDGRSVSLAETPLGSPDSNGNLIGGKAHGAIDPKLGPLADNGGPALPGGATFLTHAPLAGSPVIDAGDPALVPGLGGVPEFDQRGAPYSRLTGSRIDIGAVESQATGGALSGDFNLDGRVDGNDFLAWQRGLGRTGVVTIRHGDATADGDVDANDLAVWKARAAEEAARGRLAAVSHRKGESADVARVADAVFAAGDFSALLADSESPSARRGKFRPRRRGF
jgi:hypothetical protein